MTDQDAHAKRLSWFAIVTGICLILVGAPIAYGGGALIKLGGSAYYLPAGIALILSGVLLVRQHLWGVWVYIILYVATLIWAISEVGLQFWPLSPRIVAPTVLAIPVLLSLVALAARKGQALQGALALKRAGYIGAATMALLFAAFGVAAMYPHDAIYGSRSSGAARPDVVADMGDWTAYGRTNEGRRFVPFTQIDKQNVSHLEVAWTAHTGDIPDGSAADQNTPLQIGDMLVTCSPNNIVHGLDAETGKIRWTFNPHSKGPFWQRCRSVSYFKAPAAPEANSGEPAGAPCAERIVMTTVDARLIERDLHTGEACADFGKEGTVDLVQGLGNVPAGSYFLTSAPTVAKDLIVIGGLVIDSADVDVPSGVVRAFDARTGALRWVWDLGHIDNPNALPSDKTVFTRGTPNVWAPPSVDEERGLVFLPTGNASPDHWGGHRTPAMEKHASAVVALDLATGKERWTFQTTHHDLWDYDVPSQPTLYDIPDGKGGRIPALIQPTKRGEIFVLDRRTGTPVTRVEEKAVPRNGAPGDWTSPTQPYSVGMPTISRPRMTEADMWGFSPFDQLWCRIAFRKLRYDGDFTPPRTDPSLLFPGVFGGMNWGGGSVDETNDYLIVNDIRVGQLLVLVPRAEADREGDKVLRRFGGTESKVGHGGLMLQKGTPFAAIFLNFMSPLGVPCQAPPYGTLTAIDLKTKKIAWQVPMGTVQDTGPLGMKMHVPMPIGLPTLGGSLVTKSGLIFFAGTQDFYLRAIDSSTGREVWKSRMPVGAAATPMSYVSPRSGRQFIVISASGSRDSPAKSDLIIAYALPK